MAIQNSGRFSTRFAAEPIHQAPIGMTDAGQTCYLDEDGKIRVINNPAQHIALTIPWLNPLETREDQLAFADWLEDHDYVTEAARIRSQMKARDAWDEAHEKDPREDTHEYYARTASWPAK